MTNEITKTERVTRTQLVSEGTDFSPSEIDVIKTTIASVELSMARARSV